MFFPLTPVDTAHLASPSLPRSQGKILFAQMLKESLNSHFSRSGLFTPGETHKADVGKNMFVFVLLHSCRRSEI